MTYATPGSSSGMYKSTGRRLGAGAFCSVYEGSPAGDSAGSERIALKFEALQRPGQTSALEHEANMLAKVGARRGCLDGVPSIRSPLHLTDKHRVLGIDLLSYDVLKVSSICEARRVRISPRDCLKIADEILTAIRFVHSKGVVHRDIKPDNIALNESGTGPSVVLIDFGLAKPYLDPRGAHVKEEASDVGLVGTARFASCSAHSGVCSRRDDIVSLAFTLIYLLKGRLPWQGMQEGNATKQIQGQRLFEKKWATTQDELCTSRGGALFPAKLEGSLRMFLQHAYGLGFTDTPNYSLLQRALRVGASACGYTDLTQPGFQFRALVAEARAQEEASAGGPAARRPDGAIPLKKVDLNVEDSFAKVALEDKASLAKPCRATAIGGGGQSKPILENLCPPPTRAAAPYLRQQQTAAHNRPIYTTGYRRQ